MAENSPNQSAPSQMVSWVGFPKKQAVLKRLLDDKGNPGLILRVADNEDGKAVLERAVASGFKLRAVGNVLTMVFERGVRIPYTINQIGEMIGGEMIRIPREKLLSKDMVINLFQKVAPKSEVSDSEPVSEEATPAPKAPADRPDPETMEILGLNMRGEEVIRDRTGRFFRKVVETDGTHRFVHEGEGGQPALFFRARKAEDLSGIAAGIVRMARKGTLHMRDYDRILDAVLEEGPEGRLEMSRFDVSDTLREQILRQITSIAIENDSDRSSFYMALRVSANAGFVISRATEKGDELRPGAGLLSLFRRLARGQDTVDFRGDRDLSVALPKLTAKNAGLQVHDFSDVLTDGAVDYAMNVLSRRPAEGSSIFIIPEDMADERFERLRSEIGRSYGLEAVAEIASGVADGVRDGRSVRILFIGDRRPEVLESLPQAALRSIAVTTLDDLVVLEREVVRARVQIKDFNKGEVALNDAAKDDDRAENIRQRPYQPLSRVGEPFTMIPKALEGATAKALQRVARDAEEFGGVDAMVARSLGRTVGDLGEILTPEQVDAVAMRLISAKSGRGFLEADQTGVGKGRTMAAIDYAHLRENPRNRSLYVTESATINVPDVLRDHKAVGSLGAMNTDGQPYIRVLLLTSGSEFVDVSVDPATGEEIRREIVSPTNKERKAIFESGNWPENYNLIITTYSQFNVKEDDARANWLREIASENTMLILDEAHNALNPKSNTGRNFRSLISSLPASNVAFATGTPARDPRGMDLYSPLLPQGEAANLAGILDNIASGGEVAQEAFATMLAEDGVMVRRDHDLSATDYQVHLPDDQKMLEYQETMNKFSPIVEGMIDVSTQIGEIVGRVQAVQFRQMVNAGMDERQARAMTNELSQYSNSIGGPLSNLARIVMNAIKVDQVVEAAVSEMNNGRKPLITFHSTNSSLLNEMVRDAEGNRLSEEEIAALPEMTIRDQIRRIHRNLYKMKIDGEYSDPRQTHPEIQDAFDRVEALIDQIPDLPASPIDALIERLEANNIKTGEISGRILCYKNGLIQQRDGRDRKATVDAFNSGGLDALLYNSAGATGGSYHAGATFLDQRPRTLVEFEAPIDIIKYVQAQGRGNRYDQVASPKVLSVMTGLTPEMRILQQRNGKLRSLGASVDGNRSHPLLLDDVPDLLNKVGDEATRNVLLSAPALARRLGFPKFAEEDMLNVDDVNGENDEGSGVSKNAVDSLANKVLARSIMLPAHEQDDLVQRIRMEFDVLIEELESRNANPLRPKEFGGSVDVATTTIFSGQELEENDLDTSVFLSPVYMSTGRHDLGEDPVAAERLVTMVERAITMHGSDGFKAYADRINQNLAGLLRPYLPVGYDIDAALAQPEAIPGRFNKEYNKLTDLAWVLENLQPGVSVRFPSAADLDGMKVRTVVDLVAPKDPAHYDMASAYKIKTICPGDSKPETIAVSRIMSNKMENIIFRPGISDGFNEAYLREFSVAAQMRQQMPVQILGGNILSAITIANQHSLGTISLYRDTNGQVHRGILVHDSKIDMNMLPVPLPTALIAAEVATHFARNAEAYARGDSSTMMRIWGSMDPEAKGPGPRDMADIIIRLTKSTAKIDMVPLRGNNADFYLEREGLYEAVHAKPFPDQIPDRAWRKAGTNHKYLSEFSLETAAGRDRLYTIMEHLKGVPMLTDGAHRPTVNEVLELINRNGPHGKEGVEEAVNFFDDEDADADEVNVERVAQEEPDAWVADVEGVEF